MRKFKNIILAIAVTFAIATSAAVAAPTSGTQGLDEQQIMKKVRKELVMLPYYGVFDNLAYQVEGGSVTLYGQVVHPTTRKDAERRVARIAGVERVVNQIEVLPLSNVDDSIRVDTYRTLLRAGSLYRYMRRANPSLHIVVNRGHVTLEGVVANEGDRRLAYITASTVPGVFSVTNNLRTDRERRAY
ncbi:MAG: hyperosmotically inducible periplasmic protein [Acidobacteriota bacterium]|jgi:hyperosmotically inducible protein|nr:hyperosmotically inducible periplasmic protein [Acidobacteriota bacterium]